MARFAAFALLGVLLCQSLLGVLGKGKDLYSLLEVSKGANEQQIKRSYRKLALKYHPDKVQGGEAEKKEAAQKFAEINHAYEVLSDTEKRNVYDRYGEEGLKQHEGQSAQEARGGTNIFDFFFGGGQGGGQDEERVQKGHTITIDLWVTLADLYNGKEMKVTRDKAVIKPASGTRECKCKQKLVTKQLGPGMFQQYQKQVCEQCPNVKMEREQEMLTVTVDPGSANGQVISFFEEGEPMIDGEPGDLKFVIRTLPSKRWERRGDDLLINETITLVDALTGFTRTIEHLDGHIVTLQSSGITRPGEYQQYKGEGMPVLNSIKKGSLWVQYTVAFPDALTEAQKTQVKELLGGTHMPVPPTPAS